MRKRIWKYGLFLAILGYCQSPLPSVAYAQERLNVATMPVQLSDADFEDVPKSDPAYKDADFLQRRKILNGYPFNYFNLQRTLNRYEFARCVWDVLNSLHLIREQRGEDLGNIFRSEDREKEIILTPEEAVTIKRFYREFRPALGRISEKAQECDTQIASLEDLATRVGKVFLKDLPEISFSSPQYKVDPYLNLAIEFQALGKERALLRLRAMAKNKHLGNSVFILCRMLFASKGRTTFRRPAIGGGGFMGHTSYYTWPLEPIEIVDGVPFLITGGYELGGRPESPDQYLDYCLRDCDWNTRPFQKKSAEEKQKALQKLLSSPKWKKPLENSEKDFLSAQIK